MSNPVSQPPRPERHVSATTLLVRAVALRCPACGKGEVFPGRFNFMKPALRCDHCGRVHEREPGFFLGSIYFNYGATVILATAIYFAPVLWRGWPIQGFMVPIALFCVIFPLFFLPLFSLFVHVV